MPVLHIYLNINSREKLFFPVSRTLPTFTPILNRQVIEHSKSGLMKSHLLSSVLLFCTLLGLQLQVSAQGVVNNSAKITVAANTYFIIDNGGFTNNGAAGQVTNAGTIEVDGNWTNNSTSNVFGATPTATTGGTVILDGAAQNIAGTDRTHFYNVTAGGSLRKTLTAVAAGSEAARVYNVLTLNTGIDLNSRTLTLENPNDNAIAGAGVLVAETGPPNYGILRWNIGAYSGFFGTEVYTVPFATAFGNQIPVTYSIASAGNITGTVDPYKNFSTYPTGNDNLPLPTGVNHINAGPGAPPSTNWSNLVMDRFWMVDHDAQGQYGPNVITDYPNVNLTLTYLDGEITGNADEPDMRAMRYNNILHKWSDWLYSPAPNTTNNTVTVNLTRIEDYFPIWTLADQADPLPIELARFVGECGNEGVSISWTTYSEINNDYFTLERSKNGVDFEVVDVIAGAGNSNSPITYNVVDQQAYGGTSYYRLKSTDYYGEEEYSQVVAVTCGTESTDFTLINAYEIDHLDLLVEFTARQNENYIVTLYDASGRLVFQENGKAGEGMNRMRLPVGGIAKGIYIVDLQNETKRFSRKVLMKR